MIITEQGIFLTFAELHQLWEAARRHDIGEYYYQDLEDYLQEIKQ